MIVYCREETVTAVQDFIAVATKIYLDEIAYISPPSTGWPSTTPKSIRPFDKTGKVVKLLRYLPYPSDEDPDTPNHTGAILYRLPARRLWPVARLGTHLSHCDQGHNLRACAAACRWSRDASAQQPRRNPRYQTKSRLLARGRNEVQVV